MFEPSTKIILGTLQDSDIVLDVGGWGRPFNRANYVIDLMSYEGCGLFGSQGGDREYFSKENWVQWDICSREPFPFKDKQFDFVICSHTLEDIRDPIWVCQEIMRIGKRGYIETPSRIFESCPDAESSKYSGYWHHRWLVELVDNELVFLAKTPLIDSHWKYHFPKSYGHKLKEEQKFLRFFWKDHFRVREKVFPFQPDGVSGDYESFVFRHQGWPSYCYQWLQFKKWAKDQGLPPKKSLET